MAIHHNASLIRKRATAVVAAGARRSSLLAHMLGNPGLRVRPPVEVESADNLGYNAAGVEVNECKKCTGVVSIRDSSAGEDERFCECEYILRMSRGVLTLIKCWVISSDGASFNGAACLGERGVFRGFDLGRGGSIVVGNYIVEG